MYFFQNILNFSPFQCYPNVIARVAATGDLYWPCRPLNTFAGNLLEFDSYDKAVREGIRKYGILNACEKNCQLRCYIESSILVKHPLSLVEEFFTKPEKALPAMDPVPQALNLEQGFSTPFSMAAQPNYQEDP